MKIVAALITLLSWANIGNGDIQYLDSNCGISISDSGGPQFKMLGGATADMFGNPWMALILSNIICGGSLITNRFVLTAGHCTSKNPIAYLGEFDRSTATDCSTKGCMPNPIGIPVDDQIRHPYYVNGDRNDIALFRLRWPVQYTDFIRPICLPVNYDPLPHTAYLTVTGWGRTEYGIGSNVLKITTLTQANRSYCSKLYNRSVDMSHICAGDRDSHVCRGDSGGPVSVTFLINGEHRTMQVGLVSYGDDKCKEWSVFTNVIFHMRWIENIVRPWQGY